jgi:hypothetical protein
VTTNGGPTSSSRVLIAVAAGACLTGCYLTHERSIDGGPRPDSVVIAPRARCLTLVNPSFDDPPSAVDVSGATTMRGWRVEGDIDVLVSGGEFGVGVEGQNFIDLNGLSRGTLSEDVTGLEVGATYVVAFSLTGNSGSHPLELSASDAAGTIARTSYVGVGPATPIPSSAWRTETFTFVARSASATFVVRSGSDDPTHGPMLDAFRCPDGVAP